MSNQIVDAMRLALSPARLATYEQAMGVGDPQALLLYAWNADVSGAFWVPLHLCEVVLRNAVDDALSAIYGPHWPWSEGFERSLPDPGHGHSPRRDLQKARRGATSTGKVLPELPFAFWQSLFTSRHDERLWRTQLFRVLPHGPNGFDLASIRMGVHRDLGRVRSLRNRIAHHEPIFGRDLQADFQAIFALIALRCPHAAAWTLEHQRVKPLLEQSPLGKA